MKQVKPKKNLGQHFLTDLTIARRIADTVDACPGLPVLEVGPGMGVLTQYLMEKPRELKLVEIDTESVAYLKEYFSRYEESSTSHRVSRRIPEIIEGDFLRMDLRELFQGGQFVLTGNYPYDISSQIFFKMIDNRDLIPCCTGMIQREVAQRIASQPGTKAYGILSVLIQAWYDVEYLFTVDEGVFNPPPKVKSAVIRMTRNATAHLGCDEQLFRRVVKTVFQQRRKMLRVSLRQLFSRCEESSRYEVRGTRCENSSEAEEGVQGNLVPRTSHLAPRASHLAPREERIERFMTKRPEQLSIEEFVELTNWVEKALCANTSN